MSRHRGMPFPQSARVPVRAALIDPDVPRGPQPGAYWYYVVADVDRPNQVKIQRQAHEVAFRPGPISFGREIARWASELAVEIQKRDHDELKALHGDDVEAPPLPDVTVTDWKLLRVVPAAVDDKLQEMDLLNEKALFLETKIEAARAAGEEPLVEDVAEAERLRAEEVSIARGLGLAPEEDKSGLVIP